LAFGRETNVARFVPLERNLWHRVLKKKYCPNASKGLSLSLYASPSRCTSFFYALLLAKHHVDRTIQRTVEPSGEKQDAEGERKADGCSAKPPAGKSKRLRIYPNAEQRNTLLAWMGVVRWT